MKIIIYIFGGFVLLWTLNAKSVPWPFIESHIESVSGSARIIGTTKWMDIPNVFDHPFSINKPTENSVWYQDLQLWVVICNSSGSCYFSDSTGDASTGPYINGVASCRLNIYNWQFTTQSTCPIAQSNSSVSIIDGKYYARGSYVTLCYVFGLTEKSSINNAGAGIFRGSLITPMGLISADQVAKSGTKYCIMPPPPNVACNINLPDGSIIDHGVLSPGVIDVKSINLNIDCGDNPILSILGSSELNMGKGGKTYLSTSSITKNLWTITSKIDTSGASGGTYEASVIIGVQPQ